MDINIDISNTILDTDRLIIRPWRISDLDDFYRYAKVDGVGEMAGWTHHRDIAETRMILNKFIDEKKVFALELKENSRVIGSLGVETNENVPLGDEFSDLCGRQIGYVLCKDFWGQGLMPEAVKRVIDYLFESAGCDFLTCRHFEDNNQSRRVIEKCGFEYYSSESTLTKAGEKPTRTYILKRTRPAKIADVDNNPLETERLLLRQWTYADLDTFHAYISVDGTPESAGWGHHTNIEQSRSVIRNFIHANNTYAIIHKEAGKVIGSLGISMSDGDSLGGELTGCVGREFGFVLDRDFWGKGLMPEAVKRVIKYGFEQADWDHVALRHFDYNMQSKRVIEKCGLTYRTTVVSQRKDGPLTSLVYALKNPNK